MAVALSYLLLLGLSCVLFVEGCHVGWSAYKGKCYKFMDTKKNQSDARSGCSALGGYLAEPRTKGENDFVKSILKGQGYIGYRFRKEKNEFVGEHSNETMTFKNWVYNAPSYEMCVKMLKNGKWKDISCDEEMAFVCEYKGCRRDWSLYASKCYKLFSRPKNQENAKAECTSLGAYLTEPRSSGENAFVGTLITATTFIGYNDRDVENSFVGDNSNLAMVYNNWNPGEPNNLNGEDCVEMYTSTRWNDIKCVRSKPFVCEHGVSGVAMGAAILVWLTFGTFGYYRFSHDQPQ